MIVTGLLALPLETLQQIAAYVSTAHRPSLYQFSLTSRACHRASTSLIFRNISIVVYNAEILRREVAQLSGIFSCTDSARHVRCITIKGSLQIKAPKPVHTNSWLDWWRGTGLDEVLVDEDLTSYHGRYSVYDDSVIEKDGQEDMAWGPLVNFIEAMPHLRDLVYDCKSQLPPSLLRTLHERQPQCRLHHLTFRFRTLLWGTPFPYEMELVTSPSLYRIKVCCAWRDSDGDDDFNEEAIREVISGFAPNLKEITVLNLNPMLSRRYVRRRELWHGLPGFTGGKKAPLTSLEMKGYTRLVEPDSLQEWFGHMDLSFLQHLVLEGCYDVKTAVISGETMHWVAQNCSFPQLRTLRVYLCRDDMFLERPLYTENAIAFLRTFNNLQELSVVGPLDSAIVDAILINHGQTLRKLTLEPHESVFNVSNGRDRRDIPFEFTKEHISGIESCCPILKELAVPVKRSMSSASEAELYRCFGEIKSLRSLFLTLDCSNWRVKRDDTYSPQFNGEDNEPVCRYESLKIGILKETFINCAVDEALARSIWRVITRNKKGRKLERLKLWTTGGGHYGNSCYSYGEPIEELSRSWLIERPVRDDHDEIVVKELGQRAREGRNRRNWHMHEDDARVFRSIWPCTDDTKSWRDDWASFPLQA